MAGVVAILVAVAGCGGSEPVPFTLENIDDPAGFLTTVEEQWHEDLANRDVVLHDEARCYFARRNNANVDTLTYCGPVRHDTQSVVSGDPTAEPSNSGNQIMARRGAWDTYMFTIERNSDSIILGTPKLALLGIDLAPNKTLFRPDGLGPPGDAAEFARPDVPTTDPGFVTTVEDVQVQGGTQPDNNVLITPLTTVTVDAVGTVTTIDQDGQELAPADGEVFRTLTVSFTRGPYADIYADAGDRAEAEAEGLVDATVSYAVEVEGTRTPVLEGETPTRPVTIIASVPESGDAQLLVSAAGVDQALSLTTGERTSDMAAAFYQGQEGQGAQTVDLDQPYPVSEDEQGAFTVSHSLLFREAMLTPFHPSHGWAEQDRVWLVITTGQVRFTWDDSYAVTLERPESASVETSAGEVVRDTSASAEYEYFASRETLTFVFDVLEGETAFDFIYEPTLTFRRHTGNESPQVGETTFDPFTLPIEFPPPEPPSPEQPG